ncbi:MAG: ribosome biogenesis GTP-binding protein YihA/YsxC [Buchnera aphidicola (Chaetogeoica yunlongensis)]
MNYNSTFFLKSIHNISKEKYNFGSEVAFIGYSNSGKSSTINALVNKNKLAKISKIPGRTQLINIFQVSDGVRLVDLPGYGYTTVPQHISLKWKKMVFKYLNIQKCLKGLIVIVDIRCLIKKIDKIVIDAAIFLNIPILLLLNKIDKVTWSFKNKQLYLIRAIMHSLSKNIIVELFSAKKKIGVDKLRLVVDNWLIHK